MSIIIPHRFIERLTPSQAVDRIRVLIIGTFNPGEPDELILTSTHQKALQAIYNTPKYERFRKVRNFYDRPQNRFWAVMDRLDKPALFQCQGIQFKNPHGLKYYSGQDREVVYRRQQAFCQKHGIFISDVIRTIKTDDISKVYTKFRDADIDGMIDTTNTKQLEEIIDRFRPLQVILNVNEGPHIPNLSSHLRRIKAMAGICLRLVPSTSGAAGWSYGDLVKQWQSAITLKD